MNPLLTSALLGPLESVLNAVLVQDPAASARLHGLSLPNANGQHPVIAVYCTGPISWQFYLLPNGDRIQLRAVHDGDATASVSASISAYSRVVMAENPRTALFSPDIVLSGDTHLIQSLFELFRNLDFDWEHHLAPLTGNVVTEHLSNALDAFRQWSTEAASSMRSNLQEYLHEESGLLPQQEEMEEFSAGVDELRLAVDRLEARMQRLLDHP